MQAEDGEFYNFVTDDKAGTINERRWYELQKPGLVGDARLMVVGRGDTRIRYRID